MSQNAGSAIRVWSAGAPPPTLTPSEPPTTLWFFGEDRARLERLRAALRPPHRLAAVGEALNAAARRVGEAVVNLDAALLDGERNRPVWDLGDLADRSPHVSPLLLDAARALVCVEALRDGGRHLFLCDDPQTARLLTATAARNGLSLLVSAPLVSAPLVSTPLVSTPGETAERLRTAAADSAAGLIARWRAAAAALAAARRLRALRRRRPADSAGWRDVDVLLVVWAGTATFPALAAGKDDMFFGALPRALAAAGRRVGFLAVPMDWVEPLSAIAERAAAAAAPTLLTWEAAGPAAIWRALRLSLRRAARRDPVWRVDGVDLGPVTARAAALDWRRGRAFQAALLAQTAQTIARLGCRPQTAIMPYENQAWEKSLRRALRQTFPDCRIVGVQHAPFPPVYASFFPSRAEIAGGLIPDALVVTGDAAAAAFAARGFPADRLHRCALRFPELAAAGRAESALTEEGEAEGRRADGADARATAVCALGVGLAEATELAAKAAAATRATPGWRLIVNFHPTADDAFKQAVAQAAGVGEDEAAQGAAGENLIQCVDAPARELIADADVLLYNASGAAFDAVAAGRPIILIGRDLDLDLDKTEGAGVCVRDAPALAAALAAGAGLKPDRAALAWRFAPADVDRLLRALGLDRKAAPGPDDGAETPPPCSAAPDPA